jgi:hypothetical protein
VSRAARVWCALLLVAGVANGCAPVTRYVDFSETKRNFRAEDYGHEIAVWSRHDKAWVVYQGTVIEAWAAYKSWEFRQAYVERYAQAYNLSEAERVALLNSQREAARQSYEFHVAVQMTNYKWNDLDKETSAWRVALVDGTGVEIAPRRIELLRLPELYESQFFPNRTEFSQSYLIRFNRAEAEAAGFVGPASGRITLRIASPLGKAELVWQSK